MNLDVILAWIGRPERLCEVGEKRLVRELIWPAFNPQRAQWGVGDDAALLPFGDDACLISTDRVPADLTIYRHGIIDERGLGGYLASLNLSDIAACGGRPVGLLLNLAFPHDFTVSGVASILLGVAEVCAEYGATVLGGDLSDAAELSLSAVAVGRVDPQLAIGRAGANAGDTVFCSRPLGVTPAAFAYLNGVAGGARSDEALGDELRRHFQQCKPMFELAERLALSRQCSSCMDNTDGLGQTLSELSEASEVMFALDNIPRVPPFVTQVSAICGQSAHDLAFGPGADLSLVGTLRGAWTSNQIADAFGQGTFRIGRVCEGRGVVLNSLDGPVPVKAGGWNYYARKDS